MPREPRGGGVGYDLQDGLGMRHVDPGSTGPALEVLRVAPVLASHPAAEASMRARSARYGPISASIAPVHRIEQVEDGLQIVAEIPAGVRLSDLLEDLELENSLLPEAALLEIAGAAISAVAAVHELPGGVAHGAVTPAHAILTPDGRVVLTDGLFAAALEALQLNREQLWRQFGVAMPASASLPRFDQRSDVTSLGMLVLALVLRRPLRADEYPRGIADLALAATKDAPAPWGSALSMWLQQALQLHPRAVFGSAVGAQRTFADIPSAPGVRRSGSQAVQAFLRTRGFSAPAPVVAAPAAPRTPPAPRTPQAPQPAHLPPSRPRGGYFRAMFSNLRAS